MSELGLAVRMLLPVLSDVCIIVILLRVAERVKQGPPRIEVVVGRDGVIAPSFVEVRFVDSALGTVAEELRKKEGGAR